METRRGRPPEAVPQFLSASSCPERTRLVRFCERLVGDGAAAEDIAQETMLVAWRQARQGRTPDDWQPYLFGIARRLCLGWRSQAARGEMSFGSAPDEAACPPVRSAAETDPLTSLLHSERIGLLDRALAELPPAARALLIAHYVDELPLREIAASLNLTENATAARMHRSRAAFARILSGSLRADAAAHGLLTTDQTAGWEATRLWCPRCGRARLLGYFKPEGVTNRDKYALRCTNCDGDSGPPLGFTSAALPSEGADVLAGVQGYRAAFKRLHRWWEDYIQQGLTTRRADCVHCGRSTPVLTAQPQPDGTSLPGFFTRCAACSGQFWVAPGGLLFHAAPLRSFWQAHPRICYEPERRLVCEGRDAALVGFADQQSSARLEIVFARDDLRPLRILETK